MCGSLRELIAISLFSTCYSLCLPSALHPPEPLRPLVLVISHSCWKALKNARENKGFTPWVGEITSTSFELKATIKKLKLLLFPRLKATSLPPCWVRGVQVPSMVRGVADISQSHIHMKTSPYWQSHWLPRIYLFEALWMDQLLVQILSTACLIILRWSFLHP